jgi:hypothetical protein
MSPPTVKERPILFTPENAQRVFDGIKNQTRRIVKLQPDDDAKILMGELGTSNGVAYIGNEQSGGLVTRVQSPFGVVGDRLWVREAFTYWECMEEESKRTKHVRWEDLSPQQQTALIERAAMYGKDYLVYKGGGVKRLLSEWAYPHPIYDHCIGRFDKTIPGIYMPRWACRTVLELTDVRVERLQEISEEDAIAEGVTPDGDMRWNPIQAYEYLWESINGKGSWDLNPWVWCLKFKKVES